MRGRIVISCCIAAVVAALGGSAAASDTPPPADCTWGASSVIAELKDGELVVSEPVTTGCIP